MKSNTPQRKLILHFDTNKTILLGDVSRKYSKDTLLMELCAGYAWGKVEGTKEDGSDAVWKLHHPKFSSAMPGEGLITYKKYLETMLHPDQEPGTVSDEEARQKFNNAQRDKRRDLMQNFIKPSGPGVKLKAEFEKINRDINLPKVVVEDLDIKAEKRNETQEDNSPGAEEPKDSQGDYKYTKDVMAEIFKDGKYHILPSFFKMMINLKKLKREFAVVFRSYDPDMRNIIEEFNKFCEGNHPCFNGRHNFPLARFDGSKGSKNYIIEEKSTGVIYRDSSNIEETSLVTGTLRRVVNREKPLEMLHKEEIKNNTVKIYKESRNIYLALTESLKDSCAFAIQDDYEFWGFNGGRADCAKPMIVDPHDYNTLQIFFDDQIKDSDYSVVDTRDLITKNHIPTHSCINKYQVKVDSLGAIIDQNYFVKQIEACEKIRQEEIEKLEHGAEEEGAEKSEWDILQGLDDGEYLRRTILPLLYPAFEIVDMERPEDPLSFISFYVLKNKHKLNIPQPPPLPENESQEGTQKEEIPATIEAVTSKANL